MITYVNLHHLVKALTRTLSPFQSKRDYSVWSFHVGMEESIGIVELRIANAQIIVNYAVFLDENRYWEDSFRVSFFHNTLEDPTTTL